MIFVNGTPEFNVIKWFVAYKARNELDRTTVNILDDLCAVAKVPPIPGQDHGFLLSGNVVNNTIARIMRNDIAAVMEYIQRDTGLSEDMLYEKAGFVPVKPERIPEAERIQRRSIEDASKIPKKTDTVNIDDLDCTKSQSILSEALKIKEPFTVIKEIAKSAMKEAGDE